MDMLTTQAILDAGLDDWRKLAQALHARYLTGSFADGLQFMGVVGEACAELDHQPEVRLADTFVDLKLISNDAVYRTDDGTERLISWVTQRDVDLARRISSLAGELGIRAEPTAVTQFELALDTADLAAVGPFWAAVLTGSTEWRRDVCPTSGSRARIRTRPRDNASMSISGSHPRLRRSASPRGSPPAARSPTTRKPPPSPSSPILTATKSASAPASTAEIQRRVTGGVRYSRVSRDGRGF
jgi:pterin-4a-carbinolamine dehydratase